MKILVCVKQVRESEARIRIDEAAGRLMTDASTSFRMNRFDESAVEEALRIKEAFPDTLVDVISVGPARAADAIRRALGMGADNGIHVVTGEGQVPDAYQTAWWIASFARDRGYRLILAGAMSEDLMQGQVGPMIAELLSMPCATFVVDQRIQADNGTVIAQRGIEGGYRQTVELDLPAVLTLQASINRPRYPSLSNMLRAGKQDLEIVEPDPLEQAGPRMETIRLETPEKSRSGVVLEGTTRQKAVRLLEILRERSLLQ